MRFIIWFLILLFFISCKSESGFSKKCPQKEDLEKSLKLSQSEIKIKTVEPSPVSGLCEVIVELPNGQKGIFYIDSYGKYIISGSILEIKTKINLTKQRLEEINRRFLSKNELSKLDKLVDFTYGTSKNTIYFITDPDCPFCKKAEKIVDKLVKEGKISVKVILLPLEVLHPEAKKKAISIICDKKGFEGLMEGYKSSNQCQSGIKKINKNIKFLINELKVTATPTFVFPDGEIKAGLVSEKFILSKIK